MGVKSIDENYNLIVAQDGSGNYKTVQEAIDSISDNNNSWVTIYIKKGVYHEIVNVWPSKTFIYMVGESASETILNYDNCNSSAGSTAESASVLLKANDFIAHNITFENSFDYENSKYINRQAVAAEPMADRQIFINCRFIGHQDTLYVRNGRQYFKDCYIQGHIDFIFGDATAVFEQCEIYSLYNKNSSFIAAPSTLESTDYGLVFINSKITGDSRLKDNSVYLGRPWHPSFVNIPVNSSATFLNCSLDSHVKTDGWTIMGSVSPVTERLKEYKNFGIGAAINASRPQVSDNEISNYMAKNILKGNDNWNPINVIFSNMPYIYK